MEDSAELEVEVCEDFLGTFFSEGSDSDDPFGIENLDESSQMRIARLVEGLALRGRELVWGSVLARILHEDEGAIVCDEVVSKKGFRRAPMSRDGSPDSGSADLTARAVKSIDRTLGVLRNRTVDSLVDAHPVAYKGDLSEGDAGLGHPVGARVHTEKDDAFTAIPEPAQILPIASRRVAEWVVDMCYWLREKNRIQVLAHFSSGSNQAVSVAHGGGFPFLRPG